MTVLGRWPHAILANGVGDTGATQDLRGREGRGRHCPSGSRRHVFVTTHRTRDTDREPWVNRGPQVTARSGAGSAKGSSARGDPVFREEWRPLAAPRDGGATRGHAAHLRGTRCAGRSRRRAGSGPRPSTGARRPPPARSRPASSGLGRHGGVSAGRSVPVPGQPHTAAGAAAWDLSGQGTQAGDGGDPPLWPPQV